jgi:hypothetical protein
MPVRKCFFCKFYSNEVESDGWENPSYLVPLCEAKNDEGEFVWCDGYIGDWPITSCAHFEHYKKENQS